MESPLSTSAERVSLSWAPDLLNASSAIQSPAAPRHPKAVTPQHQRLRHGAGQAVTALHIAHVRLHAKREDDRT